MNTVDELNQMAVATHAPDTLRPTRTGKIARLPRAIREELNRRLLEAQPGPKILAWLNADPETRRVLDRDFGGAAISLQNLSKWRQGGLAEWQLYHTARAEVQQMVEAADGRGQFGDLRAAYSRVYAVEVAMALHHSREHGAHVMEKWQCLRGGLKLVHAMRRSELDAARLSLAEERSNPAEFGEGWSEIVVNPKKSREIKSNQTEKESLDGAISKLLNSGGDMALSDLSAVIEFIQREESRRIQGPIQANPG